MYSKLYVFSFVFFPFQTANDVEAQKEATEYALRNRIAETEKAKNEDEWQKERVSTFPIKIV